MTATVYCFASERERRLGAVSIVDNVLPPLPMAPANSSAGEAPKLAGCDRSQWWLLLYHEASRSVSAIEVATLDRCGISTQEAVNRHGGGWRGYCCPHISSYAEAIAKASEIFRLIPGKSA